ncbi:MAG: glycosyltransferase [Patescibacteria group bacterium]|nr:glycosyltransferase [Patescibacteria group bacterium]
MAQKPFLKNSKTPKLLLALDAALAIFYFIMLAFFFQRGELVLFWLLMVGEVFHLWQALTFLYAIWETKHRSLYDPSFTPPVDVFIAVCGEPADVVEETVRGAKKMRWPAPVEIYILNDGFVAKKENWQEIERLAAELGVHCITRQTPGGAKAGNINHALRLTRSPFIVFFDADHIPEPAFLANTVPYFIDPKMAFVQTPQFYRNADANLVAGAAWDQQTLFFGPISKGKNRHNAATMCGTNMVIRRTMLEAVGGMNEQSIAEDFITGFLMHKNGWKSLYVPQVLAQGLAPEDFLAYVKQQDRWARGSLDVLFRYNLLFTPGLTFRQRIQYLASVSYFLSGWVVLIDALIPLAFFFTGLFPVRTSTMALASIFLPYIMLMLYTIQRSSNYSFSYRAISFSLASWNIHIKASLNSLFRRKSTFSVTPKKAQQGNFLSLTSLQIAYLPVAAIGAIFAIMRQGGIITPAWTANFAWGIVNSAIFLEYIRAAKPAKAKMAPAAVPRPAMALVPQESNDG